MDEIMDTRKVRVNQSSKVQGLLSLLILVAVLPLYTLFFMNQSASTVFNSDFPEWQKAALELKRVGQYEEAAQVLEKLYEKTDSVESRLEILHVLKDTYLRSRNWNLLLVALYKIQSLDPTESHGQYKKLVYDTLQRLGKDKDASLYLKARTSLDSNSMVQEGSDAVIATIGQEEIYTRDLGDLGGIDAAGRLQALTQLVINRLLKKESMSLMEDAQFLREADEAVEKMRVAKFLERKTSAAKISEFDLKNFYHSHLYLWNHPKGVQISHIQLVDPQKIDDFQRNKPTNLEAFENFAQDNSNSLDRVRRGRISQWVESDRLPSIGNFAGLFAFLTTQSPGFCGPFNSRRGTHFFWIRERREARSTSFEAEKEKVEKAYREEFQDQYQEKYFRQLLKSYDVKVFTDRL